MASPPVVTIAGATGRLGRHVTDAFLSSVFRSNFKDVVVLSRSSSSPLIDSWVKKGAILRTYSEDNLSEVLQGVNIVVNVISGTGYVFKDVLLKAIAATPSVYLYFPSEYGVDHGDGDDPDYGFPMWDRKKEHIKIAKEFLSPNVRVCSVYISLFTEISLGPMYGLDVKGGKFECAGSADTLITYTSVTDTAKAVASLSSLPKDKIPEKIRIAGDSVSVRTIAQLMADAGAGHIDTTELDLEEFRKKTVEAQSGFQYLRLLMGSGKIDFSKSNSNELVNPGEKGWKWKTVKSSAKEIKGRLYFS